MVLSPCIWEVRVSIARGTIYSLFAGGWLRHPLYVGWLLTFWAAPTMTAAHLVFSIATTVYILVAIQLEGRDLVKVHGTAYDEYQKQVPMLVPSLRPSIERDVCMRTA